MNRQRYALGLTFTLAIAASCSFGAPAAAPTPARSPAPTIGLPEPAPTASPTQAPTPVVSPAPTRLAEPVDAQAVTPGDWPKFRYALNNAGYNPVEPVLRPPLELKWELETSGRI